MASRKSAPVKVAEYNDLRPTPRRVRAEEPPIDWDDDVVVTPPRKTTGQTMMALRALIAGRTGQPWHVSVRLRPLTEEVDTNFEVYARAKEGSQWVGQYGPDLNEAELAAICDDVVAILAEPLAPSAPKVETDDDGEVIANNEIVGQQRQVTLANGNVVPVTLRRAAALESETAERSRLERELTSSGKVMLMSDRHEFVGYNGVGYAIVPGENEVPKVVADIFLSALRDQQRARARMSVTLNETQSFTWQETERRGY